MHALTITQYARDKRKLKAKASEARCFYCLETATAASRTTASYSTTTENTTAAERLISDTDMAKEMVHVIECQRAFSYAVKMITTSDDIEGTINSLRG